MNKNVVQTAAFLAGSGACALIYQVCWLRELRLVFGASTMASSAVLAIFMGGLGIGGIVLGRRADNHPRPLAFYAVLELCVACSAALSPILLMAVRWLYRELGGSLTLGLTAATGIRLVLSALVLGVPTFLMGGTLPAAARFAEEDSDLSRRHLAWLYGTNTLGTVLGAFLSTFYLLEVFGTRNTLWLGALLNALVGLTAWNVARRHKDESATVAAEAPIESDIEAPSAPALSVLVSAGVVGFAFLLMELVWYRMLGPILGGSTYTFGLILTMALLGIGVGGACYAVFSRNLPARISGFAITVGLEAVLIAVPYALGDRLAVFSAVLWDLGALGFYGRVVAWGLVTAVVVLPAAVVSGFQFPLLLALLGKGREAVGKQTGLAYAWNTGGAILGSLAGGFGLLPMLTAPGVWRLVTVVLGLLGIAVMALSVRLERRPARLVMPGLLLLAAFALVALPCGPTAVWRHSGIGAGRSLLNLTDQSNLHRSTNEIRRGTVWEAEGVESSVALTCEGGYAFVVNGKMDGHTRNDAATQIMMGLTGAALHPNPRNALVIGLGTGSTAGWMAEVDSMERVDVVELESAVCEVARRCAAVNEDVLNHPKVNVIVGDGREIVLTDPGRYDLIASQPSNPYRAGIASLYTVEFYRAVLNRLAPGGIFTQWVQAYEIDDLTMRIIYGTLTEVFPSVETWETGMEDLLLVCSATPLDYSVPRLRGRLEQEPFAPALAHAWQTTGVEGFFAHYVGNPAFAEYLTPKGPHVLNTDDRSVIEFGFARTLGMGRPSLVERLREFAEQQGHDRPNVTDGVVDWALVNRQKSYVRPRIALASDSGDTTGQAEQRHRIAAFASFKTGRIADVLPEWKAQSQSPLYPDECAMVAEALAEAGDEAALDLLPKLAAFDPTEAEMVRCRLSVRRGNLHEAAASVIAICRQLRTNPWPSTGMTTRFLSLVPEIARKDGTVAASLAEALRDPFAVCLCDEVRSKTAMDIASGVNFEFARPFVEAFEPNVPWREDFLRYRADCYKALNHPLAGLAVRQLKDQMTGY